MKEMFGKRKISISSNRHELNEQKKPNFNSDIIVPQRDPITTGPLKSLHITYNSKILSRDYKEGETVHIQDCHKNKDLQKEKKLSHTTTKQQTEALQNSIKEIEPTRNRNQTSSRRENSLYTAEKMKDLEQSTLFWLRSLGMLPIHKPIPVTLEEIEEEIRNGTLLCNLVEFIIGEPILGVNRNPKIETSSKSNISKAFDPLRNKKWMHQKNLIEEDILIGNKNTILALFEDIRRYYDGIPQRTSKTKSPYLGNYSPIGLGVPHYTFQNIPPVPNDLPIQQSTKQSLIQQMMSSNFYDCEKIPFTTASPTELKPTTPTPTRGSAIEQRVCPEPFFPSSQLKSVFLPSPSDIIQTLELMNKDSKTKQTNTPIQQDFEDCDLVRNEFKENQFIEESKKKKHILSWIEKGLGIKVDMDTFFFELMNGTKLAEIVARCEMSHELRGVEKNPKKPAHKINNVNRALSVLREHKDMTNCKFIWSTNDIVNGNVSVILGLLSDLFSCYCRSKSRYFEE
ncbi:calponin homology domain-containing protein [Naegleria gruberi]|uniref:Calponin homology domain-containing protein n=1 Tax=Naegleria gruberi TaxID=5762 RepID=D2UXS8_NAEGR|nr:calponin homology domain-containing protein [Naegleria gruberi]EFC50342.1 calponin homology domain-containing protein [Naegleria gruberi]|eukprot:XP_002683086.1 calponin homology domain-containing protein [Naegleria gruberi strain NEG-M]